MAQQRKTWTRGRTQWLLGTVVIFALGAWIGVVLGNIWLALALVISIGWLIAYESWRGRNQGVDDPDHGIEL